jgi:lysophospholipase L1-like esterase
MTTHTRGWLAVRLRWVWCSAVLGVLLGASLMARAEPDPPPILNHATAASARVGPNTEWWTKRHEAMNARVAQGAAKGDIGVLFIGDSITQGWEGRGAQTWKEWYEKRGAVNLGIGGDRTQHVLWRLRNGNLAGLATPAKGQAPKLAVIMIGTNNAIDTPPNHTAEGIRLIVDEVRAGVPGIKVLLLAIFPREEKPGKLRETNNDVNKIIAGYADGKDVFFLDLAPALMEADGRISAEVMPDFLHLSELGYEKWAEAMEPKVKELLGEGAATKPASGQ